MYTDKLYITGRLGAGIGGPVFINPSVAAAASVPPTGSQGSFVTQTVYGFLDFTTTIGNTVMVFSPQSAAPGTYSFVPFYFVYVFCATESNHKFLNKYLLVVLKWIYHLKLCSI